MQPCCENTHLLHCLPRTTHRCLSSVASQLRYTPVSIGAQLHHGLMHRFCLTLVMSLLLLGMQQEAQLHALTHVASLLDRPHDVGLQPQVADKMCETCVLLSGGSHALPLAAQTPTATDYAAASEQVPPALPSLIRPTYYFSRAPPVLL